MTILSGRYKRLLETKVVLISEGKVIGNKLKNYLERHPEIESHLSRTPGLVFYSTDLTERFERLGSEFFGSDIRPMQATIAY
jgi:glutamate racemase